MASRVTQITVAVSLGQKGHISPERVLNQAGVIAPEGIKGFEVDRKRLCEDNEDFDAHVENTVAGESIVYERTGPEDAQLSVIIYYHYH